LQNVVIPKAKHCPAMPREIGVSACEATILTMLRTVRFDDQPGADAKEVDDVGGRPDLPAKLQSTQTPVTQQTPKTKLGLGRGATP
jgi:hypothetical protein